MELEEKHPELTNTNAYRYMNVAGDGYCLFYSAFSQLSNAAELRN